MVWEDVFVYGIFLFAFGIVIAAAFAITYNILPNIEFITRNYTVNTTTGSQISPLSFMQNTINTMDWLFLFFAGILTLALFLSAYFLPSHPAFAVVGFIMALLWVWISPHFANVWISLMGMGIFAGFEARFPFITSFLTYLPTLGFFMGLIAMVIFYGKPSRVSLDG